jgi:hypothetical protein
LKLAWNIFANKPSEIISYVNMDTGTSAHTWVEEPLQGI